MGIYVLDEEDKTGPGTSVGGKTASSSSANRLANVPLRLWKSRNKSQSSTTLASSSSWIPEGRCLWKSPSGHQVEISDLSLVALTEIERIALQQMALARLQQMDLGCQLDVPKGENEISQQKRKPLLLRRKAATTNFFDSKERERDSHRSGLVFGLPLSKCIQNDRLAQQKIDDEERVPCQDRVPLYRGIMDNANQIYPEEDHSTRHRYLDPLQERMISPPSPSNWHIRDSSKGLHGRKLKVPQIVNICIRHLEKKGMKTLGIFRVSGSKRRVRQLKEDFDCGRKMVFGETSQPHDIAQLLKEYFRDLPDPLLPRELYHAFIAAQRLQDEGRRLEVFRHLLCLLPVPNRDTLAVLISFLAKVAQHATNYSSEDGKRVTGNKMDSSNLATVFGPNLLRLSQSSSERQYPVETMDTAQDRSDVILVIQSLIDNHSMLFQVPSQDMDSVYKKIASDDPEILDILLNQRFYQMRSECEDVTSDSHSSENAHQFGLPTTATNETDILQGPLPSSRHQSLTSDPDAKSHIRPLVFLTSDGEEVDYSNLQPPNESGRCLLGTSNESGRCHLGAPSESGRCLLSVPNESGRCHLGTSNESGRCHLGTSNESGRCHLGAPSDSSRCLLGTSNESSRCLLGTSNESGRCHLGTSNESGRCHLGTSNESDSYLLDAPPLYKASSMRELLDDSCTVSASFTVTLADTAATNTRELRHLKIFETKKEETPKARQVRYGQHKHPTSPSFTVSEINQEMSITITIPSRRQTPKQQRGAEVSGSTSFMFGNFFLWDKGRVKTKSHNKPTQQCAKTKEHLQVKSSISKHSHGQPTFPSTVTGPVLQERWKRQEIIASEHVQH